MRWLADECVAAHLVRELRHDDHDVVYAAELAPALTDALLTDIAAREKRILLTEDKDFGDLIFRWRRPIPGLVLLRVEALPPARVWTRFRACVDKLGPMLVGRYTVVENSRIRSRPLPEPLPRE